MSQTAQDRAAKAALSHVGRLARAERDGAKARIAHLLAMSDLEEAAWAQCRRRLLAQAPVALHFHPDRPGQNGVSVAESLFQSGRYVNQFASGVSAGLLDPSSTGPRARWEHQLFGEAYGPQTAPEHRPKYGAWHLLPHSDGPAPRFGSCYFLLHPSVTARSTFCFGDSHRSPTARGTRGEPDALLAALLTECFERDSALGVSGLRLPELVTRLSAVPSGHWLDASAAGNLDHYIEAQVHGEVRLERDVTMLVADPSFIGTGVGQTLESLSRRYGIELAWHGGYRLKPQDIPRDRRGPLMPDVAAQVSALGQAEGQGNWVDAYHIGLAWQASIKNPSAWGHWGEPPSQLLKWLWHLLVMSAR